MKKGARVYAELADFARRTGYPDVTEHMLHDWRKRGMLPSARGLGRGRRRPGRLPSAHRDRVMAICRYRCDVGVGDLRTITLLLWLDRASIDLDRVRSALESVRRMPSRFVRLVGHRAARAERDAAEADLDVSAEAAARILAASPVWEAVPHDDLVNAARDALRVATGRGAPETVDDLAPVATAMGLDRAHTETVEGAGPWLKERPAPALADALDALHGDAARAQLAESSDALLAEARDVANRLAPIVEAYAAVAFGFPRGAGGLGVFTAMAGRPELRVLLLYIAVLAPEQAAQLADPFSPEEVAEWVSAAADGRRWLAEHPEHHAGVESRGLIAVLRELGLTEEG